MKNSSEEKDMRRLKKIEIKEAVSWLLLAYSLGHDDACQCERCPGARKLVFSKSK